MGHVRLGKLPRTRPWREVVALVEHGAEAPQVANASIHAAQRGLLQAGRDAGVVQTVWLLTRLPSAARAADFEAALLGCGLRVANNPNLLDLATAFSRAVDDSLPNNRGRSDLGEMAQMAGVETLISVLGRRADGLFGFAPEDVRGELAKLATVTQFGRFARAFFARLLYKALDYYLSRALPLHVGPGKRFTTLDGLAAFSQALETHCWEAALVVRDFVGDWTSKTLWQSGRITRDDAIDLTHGSFSKLVKELRAGAGLPAEEEEEDVR
jgi:hypothetical protein